MPALDRRDDRDVGVGVAVDRAEDERVARTRAAVEEVAAVAALPDRDVVAVSPIWMSLFGCEPRSMPPIMTSSPGPPSSTSLPSMPIRMSSPRPPTSVSALLRLWFAVTFSGWISRSFWLSSSRPIRTSDRPVPT